MAFSVVFLNLSFPVLYWEFLWLLFTPQYYPILYNNYFASGMSMKYCDQRVYVCLSVCWSADMSSKTTWQIA